MASELELFVGPRVQADGTTDGPLRISRMGSQVVTDAHGRYYEASRLGKLYCVTASALNTTAGYPLGAAGTPLIAVWNPPGTGTNLVIIQVSVAMRANGTVSPGSIGLSGGPTATITQATVTTPLNQFTFTTTGSVAKGYVNVALTGSTALTAIRPVIGVGAATSATTVFSGVATEDTAGSVIVIPGNVVALSATVSGTAASVDAAIVWEEVPQ